VGERELERERERESIFGRPRNGENGWKKRVQTPYM
jgi:hypothetical protein